MVYDKIDEVLIPMQKWVAEHHNLPKIETIVLKHFINVCKGNIEETQKLIELHYTVRSNYPNLFVERDPLTREQQIILNAVDVLYLPKLTPENCVIQISKISDPDPDKYLFAESVKATLLIYDNLFVSIPETQIIDGLISIFDSKNFSLKHLSKISISALRGFMKLFEKTTAYKINQIHIINSPSYMNKIMAVIRPFMGDHINKMIKFHEPNSETLFKYVPKELVPIEFGGTGESIDFARKKLMEDLKKNRNYLMDSKYWKMKDKDSSKVEKDFKNLNLD